ncbi:hypothetical protein GCM10011321_25570 [Youhaiella tibetensis]|nr:hypothetical protein GCM10011321_25570 [Youhaiella tibetensis]
MKICGVAITGSTANLAIVFLDENGSAQHYPCQTRKISLDDEKSYQSLAAFAQAIAAFAHENGVDAFCIKERALTGPMAGGGTTFKIETLIQYCSGKPVHFVHANTLRKFEKTNLAGLPAGLQAYLHDPYRAGAYHLSLG